jgi:hypothetical protein
MTPGFKKVRANQSNQRFPSSSALGKCQGFQRGSSIE